MPRYHIRMELKNPYTYLYLLSASIKNIISVYGGNKEVFVVFDSKGQFITYSEIDCYDKCLSLYKTTIKALYLFIKIECFKEFDFFLIKIIEKRILLNYSAKDIADAINISEKEYIDIEAGLIEIEETKRKEICDKLNITAITKSDFLNIYFKQIR